jgi:hypothetical protein
MLHPRVSQQPFLSSSWTSWGHLVGEVSSGFCFFPTGCCWPVTLKASPNPVVLTKVLTRLSEEGKTFPTLTDALTAITTAFETQTTTGSAESSDAEARNTLA